MSGINLNFDVVNQKGTPAFYSDIFANRPTYGYPGRIFISTDTSAIYEDTGSAWTLISNVSSGAGTLEQVTTNGNTTTQGIVISAGNLAIGTTTAGAPLDIHTTTGTAAQFNGTTTNNAFVFFQNAGTSKWRVGNLYNAGANSFQIYDVLSGTARLTILNSGDTTLNGAFNGTSASFSSSVTATDLRYTNNGYLTYDVAATGTNTMQIRSGYAGAVLSFSGIGAATFSNNILVNDSFGLVNVSSTSTGFFPTSSLTLLLKSNGSTALTIASSLAATFSSSVTATSLVKSGGTSAQILAADGTVITAGTNITISGGTISASGGGGSMAIGGSITSATAGSVLYAGASGVLAQSNANFYFDYTNNRLGLNTNSPFTTFHSIGDGVLFQRSSTDVFGVACDFRKSRGSSSSPTNVSNGDGLLQLRVAPYSGSTYNYVNTMLVTVDGTFTSGQVPPTAIGIYTNTAGGTATERIHISSGGSTIFGGSTDAGYKLDVQGTARATTSLTIGSASVVTTIDGSGIVCGTSGSNPVIALNSPTSASLNIYFDFRASNSSKFQFGYTQAAGNNRFFIYNNGAASPNDSIRITESTNYVAIGNFTPLSKLEVAGNMAVGSTGVAAPTNGLVVSGTTLLGTSTDSGQGVLQVSGGITAGGISLTGEVLSATATLNKGYYHVFTGSTGQTLTLPSPSSNNYIYVIINNTANAVTIAAATSTNIITTANTSVASFTLIANARTEIIADGNNKYYQIY